MTLPSCPWFDLGSDHSINYIKQFLTFNSERKYNRSNKNCATDEILGTELLHFHLRNKIATLVGLSAAVSGADVIAKDVAMQAAAMNPVALNESGVDQETIEKEIIIFKSALRDRR